MISGKATVNLREAKAGKTGEFEPSPRLVAYIQGGYVLPIREDEPEEDFGDDWRT